VWIAGGATIVGSRVKDIEATGRDRETEFPTLVCETPEQTAVREVWEETGLKATLVAPLGEIRYVYQFRGQRIFKRVHFFLFRYQSGVLGDLQHTGHRVEVDETRWVPLQRVAALLGYKGEKAIAARAARMLLRTGNPLAGSGRPPEPGDD